MQKKFLILIGVIMLAAIVVVGGFFAYQYRANSPLPISNSQPNQNDSAAAKAMADKQNQNTQSQVTPSPNPTTTTTGPTKDLKTYTNSQYGFTFQYPVKLDSAFALFQSEPTAIITPKDSEKINGNGCYKLDLGGGSFESNGMVNGISFCESSGGDSGTGQLYSSYYYTILHGQNYITLTYVVHTPNGCGGYTGTPNYQKCTDFFNNINAIVLEPIRNSVATLTFNN